MQQPTPSTMRPAGLAAEYGLTAQHAQHEGIVTPDPDARVERHTASGSVHDPVDPAQEQPLTFLGVG